VDPERVQWLVIAREERSNEAPEARAAGIGRCAPLEKENGARSALKNGSSCATLIFTDLVIIRGLECIEGYFSPYARQSAWLSSWDAPLP
jgi:hypothetical protein